MRRAGALTRPAGQGFAKLAEGPLRISFASPSFGQDLACTKFPDWMPLSYFIVPITVFVLSLAFLGMALVRYSDDEIDYEPRSLVQHSLFAYAWHPAPIVLAAVMRSSARTRGAVFLFTVLLLASGILLTVNIYRGFRSKSAAGNRAAAAGICATVGFSTGGLHVLFSLII